MMSIPEVELVQSIEFQAFVATHTSWRPDTMDIQLFYLKLKDIEKRKLGNKFVLGEFINKIRQQMRMGE